MTVRVKKVQNYYIALAVEEVNGKVIGAESNAYTPSRAMRNALNSFFEWYVRQKNENKGKHL